MRKIKPLNHTGGESQHAYFHTSSIVKHRHPIINTASNCNTTCHRHSLFMRLCISIYERLLPRLCRQAPSNSITSNLVASKLDQTSKILAMDSYIRYYLIFLNPIYIQFIYISFEIILIEYVFRLFKFIM